MAKQSTLEQNNCFVAGCKANSSATGDGLLVHYKGQRTPESHQHDATLELSDENTHCFLIFY